MLLQSFIQRVMQYDPRYKLRITLHKIRLRLLLLYTLFPSNRSQKNIILTKDRCSARSVTGRQLRSCSIAVCFVRTPRLLFALSDTVCSQIRPGARGCIDSVKLRGRFPRACDADREFDACFWRSRCGCKWIRIHNRGVLRMRWRCCKVQVVLENICAWCIV